MTLTPTLPTGEATGLSIAGRRRIQAGLVARAADGTPRTGVLPAHFNPLVTGRASVLGYDIAQFVAVTSRQAGGVEFVANDAPTPLVPAVYGPPPANSRLDVIWARPQFEEYTDPGDVPLFGLTQGTAAFAPSKPVIPSGALELAVAEVKSTDTTGATVIVTQTHRYTAMTGGVVAVRNADDLAAWAPADGARAFRHDTQEEFVRESGAWVGGWVAYEPTWTAATSNPSIGDGSITARYRRIARKLIALRIEIEFGSTTSGGAGAWQIGLPFPAHAVGKQVLTCEVFLAGPVWEFAGVGVVAAGGSTISPRVPEGVSSSVLKPVQNANAGGGNGTGIPLVGGAYSYTDGSTVVIEGIVEIA